VTTEVKASFLSKSPLFYITSLDFRQLIIIFSFLYIKFEGMMTELKAEQEAKPRTLDDILTMGGNKENAYADAFCDYILPAVCGC